MPRAVFDSATDYYSILGVPSAASPRQIQAAYRRLAKTYHPDLHAGSARAAARMARLNQAKAILLDPPTRAAYDAARRLRREPPPQPRSVRQVDVPIARPAPAAGPGPRRMAASRAAPHHLDRQTIVLLAVVVPLVGALLAYVVDAAQVAARPARLPSADLALAPISRPSPEGTARAAFTLVAGQEPNRRAALAVSQLIQHLPQGSPESESLRAIGRQLQRAAAADDPDAWHRAVADLCRLAGHC